MDTIQKNNFTCNNSKIKDLEHKIQLLKLENKSLKKQLNFYLDKFCELYNK